MRIFFIAILCVCLILTACTSNSEKTNSGSNHDPTSQTQEQENSEDTNQSNSGLVEDPKEVDINELGPFKKGLSLDEMKYDEKYQDIVTIFKENLTAWAAKDKTAFKNSFISEDVANSQLFLLENDEDFEFVGTPYIIDQFSENGRINIVFYYRTSGDERELKMHTTTFAKNKDDSWRVALID
ncbi:hypothetical protein [Paenibacillus sp. 843]|uniref:hypothetical protein n=1 Tax=Paenibacillus sp. 843 TaxID=3341795 RepID=UPI00372909F9